MQFSWTHSFTVVRDRKFPGDSTHIRDRQACLGEQYTQTSLRSVIVSHYPSVAIFSSAWKPGWCDDGIWCRRWHFLPDYFKFDHLISAKLKEKLRAKRHWALHKRLQLGSQLTEKVDIDTESHPENVNPQETVFCMALRTVKHLLSHAVCLATITDPPENWGHAHFRAQRY